MIAPLTVNGKTFQVTRKAIGHDIHWSADCPFTFTMEDCADLQRICGYDSAGYGFGTFHLVSVPAGYRATWSCATSCD